MNENNPPRSANLRPGFDETDPYEGEDLNEYPDWWRDVIFEFREHGLRPYRPPKFDDGVIVQNVLSSLEDRFDVEIRVRKLNPSVGDDWEIWLEDECVGQIERKRNEEGRTVYAMDSDEFKRVIENEL